VAEKYVKYAPSSSARDESATSGARSGLPSGFVLDPPLWTW